MFWIDQYVYFLRLCNFLIDFLNKINSLWHGLKFHTFRSRISACNELTFLHPRAILSKSTLAFLGLDQNYEIWLFTSRNRSYSANFCELAGLQWNRDFENPDFGLRDSARIRRRTTPAPCSWYLGYPPGCVPSRWYEISDMGHCWGEYRTDFRA